MKLIRTASQLAPGSRKVCLAIGVFDGVHLGHQTVIRAAIEDAKAVEGTEIGRASCRERVYSSV